MMSLLCVCYEAEFFGVRLSEQRSPSTKSPKLDPGLYSFLFPSFFGLLLIYAADATTAFISFYFWRNASLLVKLDWIFLSAPTAGSLLSPKAL